MNKTYRINETISVEAKASSKPGVYKVISVFWVTKLGYPSICMLIEKPEKTPASDPVLSPSGTGM